jgi:hypothetical protein
MLRNFLVTLVLLGLGGWFFMPFTVSADTPIPLSIPEPPSSQPDAGHALEVGFQGLLNLLRALSELVAFGAIKWPVPFAFGFVVVIAWLIGRGSRPPNPGPNRQ